MQNVEVRTAQNVSLNVELAGVGTRLVAVLIDYAILYGYLFTAAVIASRMEVTGMGVWALIVTPFLLYFLVAEATFDGQTIGKRLMKIRVRNLDGTAPSIGDYVIRWLLRPVDVFISGGSVGLTSIIVTRESQRLGDLAAGTTVVRHNQKTSLRDLSYMDTEDGHSVTFPQVDVLTDQDVQTARDVLNVLIREGRSATTQDLGERMQTLLIEKMGIAPDWSGSTIDFLKTVIRDYNHVHGRV
jgi:uncharacterized RDD family membrane protein YckC